MTRTTKLGAVVLASAALFAAGCGSDDKSDNDSGSAAPPAESSTASATPVDAVAMKNIAFDPKDATVKVGKAVTWTNDDTTDHNVTATEGADFKSDDFGKDGTYKFTPEKAGTIKYTCTLHPGMDGTLNVK